MDRDIYDSMLDAYNAVHLDEQGGGRGSFRKTYNKNPSLGSQISGALNSLKSKPMQGRISPSKQNMSGKTSTPAPKPTAAPAPRPTAAPAPRPTAAPATSSPTPKLTTSAAPAPTSAGSTSASTNTGSKPNSPFKSSRLNNALSGIKAGAWKNKSSMGESMENTQRSRNMADAYRKMYEAKGYQEGGEVSKKPTGFPMPIIPVQMINKKTEVNIDVNPQKAKIGDVEKAYYTYPAGFDPTGREDVTRKGTTNESVEEDLSDEEFFDYMVEEGLCESAESAEVMFDHMSDEWVVSLYEEAKKKKGRCWTGYEPTPGKEAFSPGSCKKA